MRFAVRHILFFLLLMTTLSILSMGQSCSATKEKELTRRQTILREVARLKALISKNTNLSPDYFVAYKVKSATEAELETDLINLYVATFGMRLQEPLPEALLSEESGSADLPMALEHIDMAHQRVADQLTKVNQQIKNTHDPKLAVVAARLKASLRFWKEERVRRIDATKIR